MILILPETFFRNCAVLILVMLLLWCAILILADLWDGAEEKTRPELRTLLRRELSRLFRLRLS